MDRETGRTDGGAGPVWPKTAGRRAFLKGVGAAGAAGLASSVLRSNNARAATASALPAARGTDAPAADSGSGWSLVQKPADSATGTSNPFANATAVGNLLVAWVTSNSATAIEGPPGWTCGVPGTSSAQQYVAGPAAAINGTVSQGQWWFYYNNPGFTADTSFTWSGPSTLAVEIAEFTCTNVSMVARPSGWGNGLAGAISSDSVSTGNNNTHAGDLVLAGFSLTMDSAATVTWTGPSGFTQLGAHASNSATYHDSSWYNLAAAAAGTQTCSASASTTGTLDPNGWVGSVVTFTEPVPAAWPSVVSCSGQNLVDANGYVLTQTMLRGLDVTVQGTPWMQSDFEAMMTEGAQIFRLVIYWYNTGNPTNGCMQPTNGTSVSSAYVEIIDETLANIAAAAAVNNTTPYVIFNFYYGPSSGYFPTWPKDSKPPYNNTYIYSTDGEYVTQYLANRYGNPDTTETYNGTSTYNPMVIGFQLNEPSVDSMNPDIQGDSQVTTMLGYQATMTDWIRGSGGNAPAWIVLMSPGYGGNAIYANAPGSNQTTQTFTSGAVNPLYGHTYTPVAGPNFGIDLHDYFLGVTGGAATDGRTATGGQGSSIIHVDDSSFPSYPPTGLLRSQCQTQKGCYLAPQAYYCSPAYANCPFFMNEWGWVPVDGTNVMTGGSGWASDNMPEYISAGICVAQEWDYGTSQSSDKFAAFPGTSADGTGSNGWQNAANTFFSYEPL
jgi:hypothetical protein